MALFIGAYLPDRELDKSAFCKALTKVAIDLSQFRQHPLQTSKPNLDLYFLMPGRDEEPDFQGMRYHSFDDLSNTLRMESAVPKKMVQSVRAEDFVVAAMQDAVDGAYEFFELQQMPFQRNDYLQLIDVINASSDVTLN